MDIDNLKFIYGKILHQIDKTDTKANLLLVIQLAVIGYFLVRLDDFVIDSFRNNLIIINLSILVFFIILTLIFIFLVIWPRFTANRDLNTQSSLIYFKHIVTSYKSDNKKLLNNFKKCDFKKFENDLCTQIICLSEIALSKYRNIRIAIIFMIVQFVFLILFFVLFFTNK